MERIDYSQWQKISLSVSNLKLDKDNPRIPSYASTKTVKDIISYLIEHEQIERLANKIVEKGFICHDPIYVVKENDRYVVAEGNRRVAALQCLFDPNLVSNPIKRKGFEKLKNKFGSDLIEKVDVYVAPSRRDIENVLFELHAEGKLQWSRQQKNKFIAEIGITSGESIENIADRFNVKPSEIQDSVQEYLIEKYFTEIGLPTNIENKVLQEKFNISTLSRLLNASTFKTYTGFKIDGNRIITTISKNKFNSMLKKFITDIAENIHNSRTLNDGNHINSYINKVIDSIPEDDSDETVSFTPINEPQDEPVEKTSKKTTKKIKETLIPKGKNYRTGSVKLNYLIEEAQGMWIDTHKTAGALLLRTILELSVVRVFELNGSKSQCLYDDHRVRNISDNIKALTNRAHWFENKAYLEDLKAFISKDSPRWNSLQSLNRYAHGEYTLPDRELLKSIWLITEPLIEMVNDKK